MDKTSFKDKDAENLAKLLNIVAEKADFNLKVKEVIELYGLLAWAQQDLMKKIKEHVLEVRAVHEPEKKTRTGKASK